MRLRPRQKTFVERSVAALASRGNTLGVAPTGAGKTIMLSAVTGEMIADGAKACVLAHRDELTAQNRAKFQRVVPGVATSVIDATEKSWGGQVAFAMVPTLARTSNLADMPRLDLLVVDEAHHAVADSYRRIIDRVREANPDARIFGVAFEAAAREVGFLGFGFYPRSGFIHIDLGPARQWGERFPVRETAFAAETPPAREVLADSRTMKGGGAAGVATLGAAGVEVAQSVLAETQTAIQPVVPYLDTLRWVFIAIALAGIAVAIYARLDDWKRGRR